MKNLLADTSRQRTELVFMSMRGQGPRSRRQFDLVATLRDYSLSRDNAGDHLHHLTEAPNFNSRFSKLSPSVCT
jgi:hypothetical protein